MVGPAKVNWLKVADGGFRSEEEKPASYVELSLQLRDIWITTRWRGTELSGDWNARACMRKTGKQVEQQKWIGFKWQMVHRCGREEEMPNEWPTQSLYEYNSSRMFRHSFLCHVPSEFQKMSILTSFLVWLFLVSWHPDEIQWLLCGQ